MEVTFEVDHYEPFPKLSQLSLLCFVLQFRKCEEMGSGATDAKEQQCPADSSPAGEHCQCRRVEETTGHVQGGKCSHEETGMLPL